MKLSEISKELKLYDLPCYCDKEYSRHSYLTGKYDELFAPYQHLPINLLEIGVYNGGSLILWNKFFSQANIHAFDKQDVRCDDSKNLDRVTFMLRDAYFDSTIDAIQDGYYDIIIEDGSHFIGHQHDVVYKYCPKIKKGGMLVVEDIHGEENMQSLENLAKKLDYSKVETYDNRAATGIYDEMLLICWK